jgi:hypothetical protein
VTKSAADPWTEPVLAGRLRPWGIPAQPASTRSFSDGRAGGGQERANYALFLTELCDLIDVDHPEPAGATHERNDYVFERVVTRHKDDGDTLGRIDLYKKDCFVLEAKQSR